MEYNTQLLLVMIAYVLFILIIGFYQGRKVKTESDFSIAGRKLPGWVAALSERATGESSWALLGLPGAAYATGLLEIWTALGCVVGILFAWIVLAWRLRDAAEKHNAGTFTDFIAKSHGEQGKWIRIVGSSTIVFFFFFYVGAQFIGGAKTLESIFELDRVWGMLIVVGLVVPYTVYGGFRSVTYTDVVQAIIMIITLIVAPIAGIMYLDSLPEGATFAGNVEQALYRAGDSYSTLTGGIILDDCTPLADLLNELFPNGGNVINGIGKGIIIAGAFSWFFGYLGGQPQLSTRFMAITDKKQAKIARNIGVVWTIVAYAGALYIGWLGIAIFGPEGLEDQETVLPEVLTTVFHPVVAGILITGVLAAVISTANSLLILSSSELSDNIVIPLFYKNSNEKKSLFISRLLTAVLSLIALMLAYFSKGDLVYIIIGYVWAGIGSTFSVVVILTLFWKKYHGKAAILTIVTGMLFTIMWISSGMDAIISARIMTFVVALLVAVISTYLLKKSPAY